MAVRVIPYERDPEPRRGSLTGLRQIRGAGRVAVFRDRTLEQGLDLAKSSLRPAEPDIRFNMRSRRLLV